MVPEPSRSPGCRLQPLEVWCATICATVQYASPKLDCETRTGERIVFVLRCISRVMSYPRSFSENKYGKGCGSVDARGNTGQPYGSSASSVTTHGDMVLAKLLARNGPSGWYSHDWMSRADQSFSSTTPNTWSSALAMPIP